jgi:hypothetical protein
MMGKLLCLSLMNRVYRYRKGDFMEYQITQNFIQKNRSYQALNAIGMVVHETATPNATD